MINPITNGTGHGTLSAINIIVGIVTVIRTGDVPLTARSTYRHQRLAFVSIFKTPQANVAIGIGIDIAVSRSDFAGI